MAGNLHSVISEKRLGLLMMSEPEKPKLSLNLMRKKHRLFALYLNGRGGLQIADQLNKTRGVTLPLSQAFWIGSAARLPLPEPEYGTFRFGRRTQKASKVEGFLNPETNGLLSLTHTQRL